MAPITSALSETLQSLTQSKIRELEKRQGAYETQKASILQAADEFTDIRDKIAHILAGVKELLPQTDRDPVTADIERWLNQARYDSSIPVEKLVSIHDELVSQLDANSRRLGLADLYSRLLMEWVNADANSNKSPGDTSSDDEDYLVVEERQKQRLQALCDQFEQVVFEPLETSPEDIHAFLDGLFPDEDSKKGLEDFRDEMKKDCDNLWDESSFGDEVFDTDSLTLCIKGLLKEDILSDAKKEMLKYFLDNKVALIEIADVLNMRYDDLKNWEWHAGEDGIPVLPTQQLNGKYRIWMDEDVLQTIFVQHIGVRLCNILKGNLEMMIKNESVWNWSPGPRMTEADNLRRQYYLEESGDKVKSVQNIRKREYMNTYFVSQLPGSQSTLAQQGGSYDNDDDDDDDDDEEDESQAKHEDKNVKQHLLRKVATETLLHRGLHGEAAAIQSDLKWYGTSLSHSTIFAVMAFAGFPQRWIDFFRKYLESPLNMDQSSSGREPRGPRIRKRGLPMAHASEKLLGELVLFFMDLAVNRKTGMLLYRLHDDLWLCGEPQKCVQAWEVMNNFAKVAGLEFNIFKTGSVYLSDSKNPSIEARLPKGPVTIGFLTLDSESGVWKIDQTQVDEHLSQLQNQLQRCDSVISWIRTWNSCIGRFFKSNFGQPAYCFGRPHVDEILKTYEKMNRVLFESQGPENGSTLTEHLRQMIKSRFGVSDVPDAFFFLPEKLGGLGLRNPFVPVLLVRDNMGDSTSPVERLQFLHQKKRDMYANHRKEFADLTDRARRERLDDLWTDRDQQVEDFIDLSTFMSFDEYMRYPDTRDSEVATFYEASTQVAVPAYIQPTPEYSHGLDKVQQTIDIGDPSPEDKWVLHLYASELMSRFGGLNLVEKRFLPVGVLTLIKEKKIRWQMVL
ncbi:hypothetical protein P170DRAFT_397036 [Aspergillus steynii IBT 23096]|uniref:Reverse transcriptase domain-containing protein n=1 Tax=Aspergillus steynii IBT 23096 TaxID=1392250 RepID=A0A2I2GMD4_9EURO|nr:uncharacterized protein P170DRAFT_397036 [Aspergillus steynii IBT 23096]PLB54036.1 hypothetical protein P170DRAFT_397036 [Aspergillus steynii IBT 23096]